ncbi:MAG TPA: DUF192 domain-containing protein [bacterium]|nr:DUF192 domain-containing protein [bacterium]
MITRLRVVARLWLIPTALATAVLNVGPVPARGACSAPLFAYRHGAVFFSERGRVERVRVELADTDDRMEIGLMCRTALDPDAGMLFLFPAPTSTPFWMKNTLIPLSIAFIDSNWHIVKIIEMATAPDPAQGPFATYRPDKPYRYALEVNAGYFTRHALDEGAEVRFEPQEGGRSQTPLPLQ